MVAKKRQKKEQGVLLSTCWSDGDAAEWHEVAKAGFAHVAEGRSRQDRVPSGGRGPPGQQEMVQRSGGRRNPSPTWVRLYRRERRDTDRRRWRNEQPARRD